MPSPGTAVGRLTPLTQLLASRGRSITCREQKSPWLGLGHPQRLVEEWRKRGKGEDPHLPGCGLPTPVKALQES